jgi:drug/metabolite transporter (DMT)-like permease
MSVLVKEAGERLPSPMMVLARAVVTLVISAAWLRHAGVSPVGKRHGLLLLRSALGFTALACFFYAVTALPLAEATVIHYLNPVLTALLAGVFLKERISASLVFALVASFAGVLLVTRPAALLDAGSLPPVGIAAALGGAVASAGAYTTVRKLRASDDPLVIVFYFAAFAVPASIPLVAPVFVMPSGGEWFLLLGIGVATQLGQVFLTRGIALVPAGRATALGYVQIVFAAAWGALLFGERPGVYTLAGGALVFVGAAVLVVTSPRPDDDD